MNAMFVQQVRRALLATAAAGCVIGAAASVQAATLNLAMMPIFTVEGGVDSNVMFTFDDSGSMAWSFVADDIRGDWNHVRGLAAEWNPLAYDPTKTYEAPLDYRGVAFPASYVTFTKARDDGYQYFVSKQSGWTVDSPCPSEYVDLSKDYLPTWYYADDREQYSCDGDNDINDAQGLPEYWGPYSGTPSSTRPPKEKAYYYKFKLNTGCGTAGNPSTYRYDLDSCYEKVTVAKAEEQNFANWYSYYRKRTMTAKAGVSRAFARIPSSTRVGFALINKGVRLKVDKFEGTQRQNFYKQLFMTPADGVTPLRNLAKTVGDYFMTSGTSSPWDDTPADSSDTAKQLSCRHSFHVMSTDGYWNSDSASVNNVDKANATYLGKYPFSDEQSNTLADVAAYYYVNDLVDLPNPPGKPDDNNVPPRAGTVSEPTHQHLVTYALAFGLKGLQANPDDAFAAIQDSTVDLNEATSLRVWPDAIAAEINRVDDLLHAAVNTQGGFSSVASAQDFVDSLGKILTVITATQGSAASVVLNSAALRGDTYLYQAKFHTQGWWGELLAYEINEDNPATTSINEEGTLAASPTWDAGSKIAYSGRKVVTYRPDPNPANRQGIRFQWADLTLTQKRFIEREAVEQALAGDILYPDTSGDGVVSSAEIDAWLNGTSWNGTEAWSPVLNYLRGDDTKENTKGTGGIYRDRKGHLLGDIIDSAPAYVGVPTAPYPNNWGASAPENAKPYSTYRYNLITMNSGNGRAPMIYVGANDGMLHAFDAVNGTELFAYVPNALIPKIETRAWGGYTHDYFVDGSPTVGEAFVSGDWRTVLVGGLNGGGKAVYAIDVTEATAATEAGAAAKVLWEFADTNTSTSGNANGDTDLGYTYSRPNIVRLKNGKWAAVFGNGYNSTTAAATAVLFIVDLENGTLIKKISTTADSLGRANGLATVAPVDVDGDFIVDYVYGGDLVGNMWKFDLNSTNTSQWKVAFSGQPLFNAVASNGAVQPITTRPQVIWHPTGLSGYLVLFGTGKYLEVADNNKTSQDTQTFYAVWDNGSNGAARTTNLLKQEIFLEQTATDSIEYRFTTDRGISWKVDNKTGQHLGWYVDLAVPSTGDPFGERQVADSVIRNNKVIFTTLLPSDEPCLSGGGGWLMELDVSNGGRPDYSLFDINHNGAFDDYVNIVDKTDPTNTTTTAVPPTGRKSSVGIVPTPAILSREAGGKEYKYAAGSRENSALGTNMNVEVIVENAGPGDSGRNSWIQLLR